MVTLCKTCFSAGRTIPATIDWPRDPSYFFPRTVQPKYVRAPADWTSLDDLPVCCRHLAGGEGRRLVGEPQLWNEMYAPQTAEQVCGNADGTRLLRIWLGLVKLKRTRQDVAVELCKEDVRMLKEHIEATQADARQQAPPQASSRKRPRSEMDDFIMSDTEPIEYTTRASKTRARAVISEMATEVVTESPDFDSRIRLRPRTRAACQTTRAAPVVHVDITDDENLVESSDGSYDEYASEDDGDDDDYEGYGSTRKTRKRAAKEQREIPIAMVISGGVGCGKTAAVFACAREAGYQVFELNASNRRTGRDIIEFVGGMTNNHLVYHRAGSASDNIDGNQQLELCQSLLLLEEVDELFEEDKGFWAAVRQLASTSKRPVILTCDDYKSLPASELIISFHVAFESPVERVGEVFEVSLASKGTNYRTMVYLKSFPLLTVISELELIFSNFGQEVCL